MQVLTLSVEQSRTCACRATEKGGSKRVLALSSEERADGNAASERRDDDDGDDVLADNFAATTR